MVSFRSLWNRLFTSVPPAVPVASQAPTEVSSVQFDESPEFWTLVSADDPELPPENQVIETRMSDSCVNLSRESDGLGVKFECVHAVAQIEFIFPTSMYDVQYVHDVLTARSWISVEGYTIRRNGVRAPLVDVCRELTQLGMLETDAHSRYRLVSTIPVHIV